MKPADFPIERVAQLEQLFVTLAETAHIAARQAALVASAAVQHGYAEASHAYATCARSANMAAQRIIADLDRSAHEEASPGHTWPIENLVDLGNVHRDDDEQIDWSRDQDFDAVARRRRFPRWGAWADAPGMKTAAISVEPSGIKGELFLRATLGGGTQEPPIHEVALSITLEQWDALAALVERIRAGEPIPYNQDGHIRTEEKTP